MDLNSLVDEVLRLEGSFVEARGHHRVILGIAGPPGSGKSTLAQHLVDELKCRRGPDYARNVPMDGFHLRNEVLDRQGLRPVKGAPQTFDVEGYVAKLRELRETRDAPIGCPIFDRHVLHEPVENGVVVPPETRVVVTDGNYLLLNEPPWDRVRPLLDQVWYVTADIHEAEDRLKARHRLSGNDEETVRRRVYDNDLVNFALVERTISLADRMIGQLDFFSR